jgi:FtsP/CotA-like multicopper oxidase with cupredoxin domain
MNRRHFTSSLFAGAALLALPGAPQAALPAYRLAVIKRTIEVNGKSASVYGITRPNGRHGLSLDAGSHIRLNLHNRLAEKTMVHWHGLTPRPEFDGAPDMPLPLLKPQEQRQYHLPAGASGTHWMHAHTLQEQRLLAAPLIVRDAADRARDEQDIVVLLHDFSFTSPEELLAGLQSPAQGGTAMPAMDHAKMMMNMATGGGGMAMDLNDIAYDAYLANDRTLADPQVWKVEKGGMIRLRIINGATGTAFTIDTGELLGTIIAVDGQDVEPLGTRQFPLSMGQRVDIRLQIPKAGGAFPVLALREGAPERTGIILATPGTAITTLAETGAAAGPTLTLDMEANLKSARPLLRRQVDRSLDVMLMGSMQPYQWSVSSAAPIAVTSGERVLLTMRNHSMMTHPMHLHGHHFQVVAINGREVAGALRDTVLIPPMATVSVAFDANNKGKAWAFHCHHLYHMASGMMAALAYTDA